MEAEYSIKNGREHDAEVIYGDTDSVMVKFGCSDLDTAMALGKMVFSLFVNTRVPDYVQS